MALVQGLSVADESDAVSAPSMPEPPPAPTTGMVAVTVPVIDGTNVSAGAKPPAPGAGFAQTFEHSELGWCCHLVPPGGPVAQMFEFNRLREVRLGDNKFSLLKTAPLRQHARN